MNTDKVVQISNLSLQTQAVFSGEVCHVVGVFQTFVVIDDTLPSGQTVCDGSLNSRIIGSKQRVVVVVEELNVLIYATIVNEGLVFLEQALLLCVGKFVINQSATNDNLFAVLCEIKELTERVCVRRVFCEYAIDARRCRDNRRIVKDVCATVVQIVSVGSKHAYFACTTHLRTRGQSTLIDLALIFQLEATLYTDDRVVGISCHLDS